MLPLFLTPNKEDCEDHNSNVCGKYVILEFCTKPFLLKKIWSISLRTQWIKKKMVLLAVLDSLFQSMVIQAKTWLCNEDNASFRSSMAFILHFLANTEDICVLLLWVILNVNISEVGKFKDVLDIYWGSNDDKIYTN